MGFILHTKVTHSHHSYSVTCHLSSQPMQRSLLGNTSVTCNNTAEVARQPPPRNNNGNIVGRCFLCCPPRGYITPVTSCQRQMKYSSVPNEIQLSDSTVTGSPERDIVQKWIIVQRGTKKIEVKIHLSGRAARNIIFRR
jgi:hypothetical protein